MDLTIPGGMGGEEAIRQLLEIDPNVKAIVSSGYSTDAVMSDFKQYGFSGVITKPYTVAALSEAINKVIQGISE
jgi:DNA-binding NarL/FixJ family response regulator